MNKKTTSIWQNISLYLFLGLLAYMPLHILLSTWIGTSLEILEFMRVAKEGVLVIGAGMALIIGLQKGVVRKLLQDKLLWLIGGFVLLNAVLALWRQTDLDAELLGFAYNVRFLIYFVWAMILASLYQPREIVRTAVKISVFTGIFVVAFGLAQYFVLPDDALRHIGYTRSNGVLPVFFIDDKPDLERIMSTVRDPNSLGSYLLVVLGFTSVYALMTKDGRQKSWAFGGSLVVLLAIFLTFSRAAWIGAVITLAVVTYYLLTRQRTRLRAYKTPIILTLALVFTMTLGAGYLFRDSYVFKNIVFHADESTVLEDPNELRVRFWQESVADVAKEPLGGGPGTAGLASIRNDEKTVLNENYYLQMAQETGILGLMLFMAILIIAALRLYNLSKTQNLVAIALLASLAGLMITNFLAHIWANEAVAYTWWGLAGLVLALPQAKKRSKSA